jgi:hypothetical protein
MTPETAGFWLCMACSTFPVRQNERELKAPPLVPAGKRADALTERPKGPKPAALQFEETDRSW